MINIVFLSEGYKQNEMDKFRLDVEKTSIDFFNWSPFLEYYSHFNIYSIEVPSNESGTDHPRTAVDCPLDSPIFFSDTYFNSTFDYTGIHRLLVIQNLSKVYSVLQDNVPDWDLVLIIVNHTWYGGSGGEYAVFSTNSSSSELALHEAGHVFGDLADEYEYGNLIPREAPNTTAETQRDKIKWNIWIDPSTPFPTPEDSMYSKVIGLFEGAVYHTVGWYRPKLDCKMRNLNVKFCEVCKEQLVKEIIATTGLVKSILPEETNIAVTDKRTLKFQINTVKSENSKNIFNWFINGNNLKSNLLNQLFISPEFLGSGKHDLEARILHLTDYVRNDPQKILHDSIYWHLDVSKVNKQTYLLNIYPNPFNESTHFNFGLPLDSRISIKIYNILGQEIETVFKGDLDLGVYKVIWKPQISSGMYIYSVKVNSKINDTKFIKTGKILLIR
jgi:hypothetical protein